MRRIVRARIAVIVAAVALSAGVATVRASEPCTRLVRVVREKLARHHISKETAAQWALWNKAHPNYHPKVKERPPLTQEEAYKKVAFACQVPTTEAPLASTYVPDVDATEPLSLIATSLIPTEEVPMFSLVGVPTVTPTAVASIDTPEPSSFLLFGSGLIFMMAMLHFRRQSAESL